MGGIVGNDRSINQTDYSSSLVAINSINGEIIWSFQDVKNDLWDLILLAYINYRYKF